MKESLLVRCYRKLTSLYPAPFREEYESELVELVRDRERESRGLRLWLELTVDIVRTAPKEHWNMLVQDLRHAARLLRKTPSVTLTAIVVLAIGIASTTTVFSIVNAVLLRPLPFASPEQLAMIEEASQSQGIDRMGPAYLNLLDYTAGSRQFDGIGFWITGGMTLSEGESERVDGAWVSANLFPLLGAWPAGGRQFLPEEERPNAEPVIMLSHGLWLRRFGGDRSVLGRTIQVNGRPQTVVGIMPPGFRFPESADIWGALGLDAKEEPRTNHFLQAIGRLKPGVSASQGQAELSSILKSIQARHPDDTSGLTVLVTPVRERLAGEYRPALLRLLAAVGLVLAIACTNIMNLLLARAAGRRREVAIRTALGAQRRRLVRQLLTECAVLGMIGGAAGVTLGWLTLAGLKNWMPRDVPYWIDLSMDWRVAVFCGAATIGSVLLFGMAPAMRASRSAPAAALNEMRRGVTAGGRTGRLRQTLVCAQVALSVVLLAGAGLMIRSFLKLQDFDLGFNARDVLTFRVSVPRARYPDAARRDVFYRRMREQLAAIPGVRQVATSTDLPMTATWWRGVQVEGNNKTRLGDLPSTYHVVVSPGYFAALGIPMKRGRDFTDADRRQNPVVVVNEKFALQQWPGGDPIGRRVRIDPFLPTEPWRTVVGVVGDVRARGAREEAPPAIYVPESFDARPAVAVLMRGDVPPARLIEPARRVMRSLDVETPPFAVRPAAGIIAEATWQFRFFTFLLSVFAGVAVLLASVGLAGIMAHMVIERTHEIAVRMAIGASTRDVLRMMLSRAFLLVAAGAATGVFAAAAATRALSSQLFGIEPHDTVTFAVVIVVLLCAAIVAAWLPAHRAVRIDPASALRFE